jgi:hypothetical protein
MRRLTMVRLDGGGQAGRVAALREGGNLVGADWLGPEEASGPCAGLAEEGRVLIE